MGGLGTTLWVGLPHLVTTTQLDMTLAQPDMTPSQDQAQHAQPNMTPATQVSNEAIRMYYGINPDELAVLLNDEDILDIEPLSFDTSSAKPPAPAK